MTQFPSNIRIDISPSCSSPMFINAWLSWCFAWLESKLSPSQNQAKLCSIFTTTSYHHFMDTRNCFFVIPAEVEVGF